jgi:hypothetical protein
MEGTLDFNLTRMLVNGVVIAVILVVLGQIKAVKNAPHGKRALITFACIFAALYLVNRIWIPT